MSGVPICERLRAYQAPGYGPSSPIRRDATEARETIEALVEALKLAREAAQHFNFRLSPHELARIDAALAKVTP